MNNIRDFLTRGLWKGNGKGKAVQPALSPEERRIYASEALYNFRELYSLLATRSSYILTQRDLAPTDVASKLSEISQYAELADGSLPTNFLWKNLPQLQQEGYPLDSRIYAALKDGQLIDSFRGSVADVHASIVFRKSNRQLILGFSGTSTKEQALRDCNAIQVAYPLSGSNKSGLRVHAGFWGMYDGLRRQAMPALQAALQQLCDNVDELIITGHSLGAAMTYLFFLDLLQLEDGPDVASLKLTLATFGTPRVGNAALIDHWKRLVAEYRQRHGDSSLRELSVRTYNDGVPALPPTFFGYKHFAEQPYFLTKGNLFIIPNSESEHCMFKVSQEFENVPPSGSTASLIMHYTRGGHNYYWRDIEKLRREMEWLGSPDDDSDQWLNSYLEKRKKWEELWSEK